MRSKVLPYLDAISLATFGMVNRTTGNMVTSKDWQRLYRYPTPLALVIEMMMMMMMMMDSSSGKRHYGV